MTGFGDDGQSLGEMRRGVRYAWIDSELSAGARIDLNRVHDWQLPAARWARVEDILIELESAFDDRDRLAFLAALRQLPAAGPVRGNRIGATPAGPPPEPVLARLEVLVHRLGPAQPDDEPAGVRNDERDRPG